MEKGTAMRSVQKKEGIVKTVKIQIGSGKTTDQITEAAKAKEKNVYINSNINQANMSSGYGKPRFVVLEFFEFDHNPTTEEIITRCEEAGYGYSTYEDGLRFQEDHPDDQRERPHIFIPENPWYDADGFPQALNLWSLAGARRLLLHDCPFGLRWNLRCLFARRKYLL